MPSSNRTPTHPDLSPVTLSQLAIELDDAADEAGGAPLNHDQLVALARSRGKPISQYYAASLLASEPIPPQDAPVKLVFCAGMCQRYGALENLDRAADRLAERRHQGAPGFGIEVRQCLDRCDRAAVCELHTPGGASVVIEATPEKIDEALSTL
jgi:hypothetical protein